MVSIAAFQAVDPGSIPGRRSIFFSFLLLNSKEKVQMRRLDIPCSNIVFWFRTLAVDLSLAEIHRLDGAYVVF
mgnify:CR=1 FL=1